MYIASIQKCDLLNNEYRLYLSLRSNKCYKLIFIYINHYHKNTITIQCVNILNIYLSGICLYLVNFTDCFKLPCWLLYDHITSEVILGQICLFTFCWALVTATTQRGQVCCVQLLPKTVNMWQQSTAANYLARPAQVKNVGHITLAECLLHLHSEQVNILDYGLAKWSDIAKIRDDM